MSRGHVSGGMFPAMSPIMFPTMFPASLSCMFDRGDLTRRAHLCLFAFGWCLWAGSVSERVSA
jgi:hypothetical protein